MAESKNYYLICYDIRDSKRWRKVYKHLEGYGVRLQYSVFRVALTLREREKLRWELEKLLAAEDSLLLVGLCGRCVERVLKCNHPKAWPLSNTSHQVF